MPTYNGSAYLEQALASVADQHDSGIEIIAVDDGSTDATLDILHCMQHRLRLSVVERPRTGNWVANTNYGMSLASADHISLLHQDDFWLPGRAGGLRDLLARWPRASLVVHPVWFVDAAGRRVGRWRCPWPNQTGPVDGGIAVASLLIQNFIAVVGTALSRSAVKQVGPMDESLWYTADWDYWLRLAAIGPTIYCPALLAAFRVHSEAQTVQRSAPGGGFRSQLETVLSRHLPKADASSRQYRLTRGAARFSIEVNTALAARLHGESLPILRLLCSAARLGPLGLARYVYNSRIIERSWSRLRARRAVGARSSAGPAALAGHIEDADQK